MKQVTVYEWAKSKLGSSVIVRQRKSLNINFLFTELLLNWTVKTQTELQDSKAHANDTFRHLSSHY